MPAERLVGTYATNADLLPSDQINVGPYILVQSLGRNETSRTYLGSHSTTGEQVVLKAIRKSTLLTDADFLERVQTEIRILHSVMLEHGSKGHPHVVGLRGILQTDNHVWLLTEYLAGGELYDLLSSLEAPLTEQAAFAVFRQIVDALVYLHGGILFAAVDNDEDTVHRLSVYHRDVKLHHILFSEDGKTVKLADFGIAAVVPCNATPEESLLTTRVGSPHYVCPEIVTGSPYSGAAADVWGLGVVLYALLTSTLPFNSPAGQSEEAAESALSDAILSQPVEFEEGGDSEVSEEARALVLGMLNRNPEERLSLSSVKESAWYQSMLSESC